MGKPDSIEVDAVIGADGANSRVAKEIGAGDYDYAIAFQVRPAAQLRVQPWMLQCAQAVARSPVPARRWCLVCLLPVAAEPLLCDWALERQARVLTSA